MQRLFLIMAVSWSFVAGPTQAADPGERLFNLHCAACHGRDARGSGTVGEVLSNDPSDLTRLAKRNAGAFPFSNAIAKIDGRIPVIEHGGEMPVYGWFFEGPSASLVGNDGEDIQTTLAIAQIVKWLTTVQR